ncbi:recF/RecN/SMC protein [Moesziomyces antarcticus]|uniref:Structural maintenance of chromosomes protein n=2 Tax=Pseudozyma antarctica TaxID=84753 RepID=A0A081CHX7_PSEA2|nr:recF/RecN/SMC protein [Moesziomyces antarcticus]GAK66273.1 recF/RecN/SMC protein [Moesziomyces antarcticus]SPO48533.1 probable SMC3 - required for structural maintenance of chromosomes [Moesziomyces antarcticus]DBA11435.1 TPA_inf: SMC3 [Moesziomyces antarcticus]
MYIKTLTIQGFKSYRDQTAVEPFSPHHNVVVGRNGSGKSNFFSAIRFVLSDAYTSMSREERQSLLHDSSSSTSATLSAFVEIVFDNSDNRFPTNGTEVVLRRTIGLKKDEYSIDRKSASKADVANLLESAGFSRSNPYYIVPQGRITHLTNAKDHERLGLLKEVAGTRVYEQRRAESIKIMEDTTAKRSKIDDLLEYIENRLRELDDEKEELREYYERDRERRCIEYSLHQRELTECAELLDKLEDERRRDLDASNVRRAEFNEREKRLARLEAELAATGQSIEQRTLEKTQLELERRDVAKHLAQIESLVEELEEVGEKRADRRTALEAQLARIRAEIQSKQSQLDQLQPTLAGVQSEAEQLRAALQDTTARVSALYSKQGRSAQFRTQQERDEYLRTQMAELDHFLRSQQTRIDDTARERTQATERRTAALRKVTEIEENLESRKDTVQQLATEYAAKRDRRDELSELRKDLWKEEESLRSSLAFAANELSNAQRKLVGMMDKATVQGLSAVDKIAASLGLQDNVKGPVYQLFTVDDKYKTAVEVVAGASLFHVVVDTDETASKLLEVMNREKSGRVTFMPLNRLHPKETDFPATQDAILMVKKMHFERALAPAMQQIFGRSIICPNLEIAAAYVRSHGVNAVTLDGDKVERKGALSGGYQDPRRSRLDAVNDVRKWKAQSEADTAKQAEVQRRLGEIEQEITALMSDMYALQHRRDEARNSRAPLTEELQWARTEADNLAQRLQSIERREADQTLELKAAQTKRAALEEEVRTPMSAGLTPQESAQLETLHAQEDAQKRALADKTTALAELSQRRSMLEIDLYENLRRRHDELGAQLEALGESLGGDDAGAVSGQDVSARRREIDALRRRISEREKRIKSVEAELDRLTQSIQDTQAGYDKTKAEQAEDARSIARQQKNVERYLSKRSRLVEQRDRCNQDIRDLGVLPEEAFEKYTNTSSDRLLKALHKVNEALKKFSHVNKKAVEQYNSFTKQRDQLLERRAELEQSAESIQELIDVLDQRKDEAIERTFKQVSKYFEEVFEKLVPAGRGRLIMQRRADLTTGGAAEGDSDDEPSAGQVENYTGVAIKVSFNSKHDEGLRIQQLSGGQKSLVALATVFAIQKCDPAPFYLFDEIDANLDALYRTAVANMIRELAHNAQFITTTFRPEMVQVASKHYGVLFDANKVSSIRSISRDEANEFVEAAATTEPVR